MTTISRIFDRILDIALALTCIFITFLMVSVSVEVVMRYFFDRPTFWTSEIAGHILLYIPFLVGAWVLKEEGHVKMDLVLNRFSSKNQALVNTVTSVVGAIVCFIAGWYGAKVTWYLYETSFMTPGVLKLPQWAILVVIPAGCFLLFIQFLRRTCHYMALCRGHEARG